MWCFLHRRFAQQLIVLVVVLISFLQENYVVVVSFDVTPISRRKLTVERCQRQHHHQNDLLVRHNAASTSLEPHNNNNNSNEDSSSNGANSRRIAMRKMFSIPLSLMILSTGPSLKAAVASQVEEEEKLEKKPFAPLENLLPAVRVKMSIDAAIGLTTKLLVIAEKGGDDKPPAAVETTAASLSTNNNQSPTIITHDTTTLLVIQLESLLLTPQNYVQSSLPLQGVPSQPANLYLKSYQSTKGDLPFQKALIQSGDIDAWKRLKRREKSLEQSSEIRAALNAYTDALSFSGESYLLKVDPRTRSRMVREDRLPDLKQVITSDMGMRYLYRNQVLTAMDDVTAESKYQQKQQQQQQAKTNSSSSNSNSSFEGTELLDLLCIAREAMNQWLSLVPPKDVEEGLKSVVAEERYQQ